mmetsp:Transcript_75134/g.244269  ORF Transcript_75134/g.244269 Transcript_75134/m.244269 type:complete len:631 (-) Transcript_75134:42-1934(-)
MEVSMYSRFLFVHALRKHRFCARATCGIASDVSALSNRMDGMPSSGDTATREERIREVWEERVREVWAELADRVEAVERGLGEVARREDRLGESLQAHRVSQAERVAGLERAIFESADMHSRLAADAELRGAGVAAHAERLAVLEGASRRGHERGDRLDRALEAQRLTVESLAGASTSRHEAQHAQRLAETLHFDLEAHRTATAEAAGAHATTLGELRMQNERLAQELARFIADVEKMAGRLVRTVAAAANGTKAFDALTAALPGRFDVLLGEAQRFTQEVVTKELRSCADLPVAELSERLARAERALGEVAGRAARAAEEAAAGLVAALERTLAKELSEQRSSLREELLALANQATSDAKARPKELHGIVAGHSKHAAELDTLRGACATHTGELRILKDAITRQSVVIERLDGIERLLDEFANKHARDVLATQNKIDQSQAKERDARVYHNNQVLELLAIEREARSAEESALAARTDRLEQSVAEILEVFAGGSGKVRACSAEVSTSRRPLAGSGGSGEVQGTRNGGSPSSIETLPPRNASGSSLGAPSGVVGPRSSIVMPPPRVRGVACGGGPSSLSAPSSAPVPSPTAVTAASSSSRPVMAVLPVAPGGMLVGQPMERRVIMPMNHV